jgi:hypothetical protein
MALTTSKVIYKQHFGPFMPGVHIAPYPYCLHCKVQAEKVSGAALAHACCCLGSVTLQFLPVFMAVHVPGQCMCIISTSCASCLQFKLP